MRRPKTVPTIDLLLARDRGFHAEEDEPDREPDERDGEARRGNLRDLRTDGGDLRERERVRRLRLAALRDDARGSRGRGAVT